MKKEMQNTLCIVKELYKQVVHLSNTWEKSVGLSLSSIVRVPLSDVGWLPYRAPKCWGVDTHLLMCGCLYCHWTLISRWHQWKLFATGLTASAFVLPLSSVGHPGDLFYNPLVVTNFMDCRPCAAVKQMILGSDFEKFGHIFHHCENSLCLVHGGLLSVISG